MRRCKLSQYSDVEILNDYATMSGEDVAEKYGVSPATVDYYIRRLREDGFTATSHRPKAAADDFVECWNSSSSLEEVAARLGVEGRSVRSLSAMASSYRQKGYQLKYF